MEWSLLVERKMRARGIVVGRIICQLMAKVPFAHHHEMVEALASDRSIDKMSYAWRSLLMRGRIDMSLEAATMIFRYANYGICMTPDLKLEDPRQGHLDLPWRLMAAAQGHNHGWLGPCPPL